MFIMFCLSFVTFSKTCIIILYFLNIPPLTSEYYPTPGDDAVMVLGQTELAHDGEVELVGASDAASVSGGMEYEADYSSEAFGPGESTSAGAETRNMNNAKNKFKCPQCPKVCHKPETLSKHLESHKEKRHACTVCPFVAPSADDLRDHRKTHMSKKCSKCDFTTNRAVALKKHTANHVGNARTDRAIICNACDFVSKNSLALKNHMKYHHDQRNRRSAP